MLRDLSKDLHYCQGQVVGHQDVGYVEGVFEQANQVKESHLKVDFLLMEKVLSIVEKVRVVKNFKTKWANDYDVEEVYQKLPVTRPTHIHYRIMYSNK